VHKDVFVI
jgi:hypothetical protein